MNSTRLFKKTVIAATIALASQQAVAAGFQLNAQSATGLGRAFAGDAVIADNASVMSRNAAAMALFDSHQFSGGVNVISTEIKVTDIETAIDSGNSATNKSDTPVPNIYYVHRLSDKIALGAGVYSNFGTKNNFDKSFGDGISGNYGGETQITSINYALAASYRVNEKLSLGAGIDIVEGTGVLKRNTTGNLLDIDAKGTGIGFNIGTVYEADENNRYGLSYHYSPLIEAKGKIELAGGVLDYSDEKLKLPLPSMLEFSGYHKITDSKFAVHYSLQWIGWSAFDKIETSGGSFSKDYKWKDGYHVALGGTYYMSQDWTFRAGYMFDSAAQDEITSISVPDSNRHWFSAGLSYHMDKHTVDFGATYLLGEDVSVTEGSGLSKLTATTHANAILAGVQYSYSF